MKSVVLILDITNDCNLRCSYCYINGGEKQEFMSVDTAYKAIEKIGERFNCSLNIMFHGGEPLLNFDLIRELITRVNQKPFKFPIKYFLQTNATNMNEEIANFIRENNINIGISFDGCTEESNIARVTENGEGSVEKVKNSIRILQNANNEISVLSVLTRKNYADYDKMIDWLIENQITSFALNPFITAGRGAKAQLSLSGQEMFETYSKVLDKIIYYNEKGIKVQEKNLYYMYKCIIENKRSYMCMNSPCGAGIALFAVNPKGDVYPCADFCNEKQFCLGNVEEDFFKEIPNVQTWRDIRLSTYDSIRDCNICELKQICPSGCSARRYYSNGELKSVDSICEFYKLIIPYMKKETIMKSMEKMWKCNE